MVEVMHDVLLEATKAAFACANFIDVSVNEVTTIDNTQWLSIHLYMVQGWKKIPILLCVESIRASTTLNTIFGLMIKGLLEFCGLGLEELARKLVNMGCNGSFVFQGHQIGVTMEFKEVVAPFMNGTLCFAHKTNLAMIILSNLPFVHQLEGVLQNLYVFFTHSLKKFLEF
jgi:hypothetical protein